MQSQNLDLIEVTYGPQVRGEAGLKRLCRLQQSWYRVERLGNPRCGCYRPGGRIVGSALLQGEATNDNFLTEAAAAYARERLDEKKRNRSLLIDRFRLFHNMLSSHPMAFNLFSDLHQGVERQDSAAAEVIRVMFPDANIASVDALEVEHLPTPTEDYIHDKTAFDSSVLFRDQQGKSGIITIETKYTDNLGTGSASNIEHQRELVERWGLCTPEGIEHYRSNSVPQVFRNLLLTIAYEKRHELTFATNYVVGLRDDRSAEKQVEQLRSRLAEPFRDRIQLLPLEELVERGLTVESPTYRGVLEAFRERYLDLSPARTLLKSLL